MRRIFGLDFIRAIAALLVCAGHLRAALLVDYAQVESLHLGVQALYFLTGLGHQAVMVFFVLSGYLVGGSVIGSMSDFGWGRYAVARLSRLWVVLLPCLLLTWVVDTAILHFAPQVLSGLSAEQWHSGPQSNDYDRSMPTLVGNVFFLQTISVPVFGSNGPLWSLANEFWYYVCFPLLLGGLGVLRIQHSLPRCIAILAICTAAIFLPAIVLQGFVVWSMGALVALVSRGAPLWRYRSWHVVAGLVVFAVGVMGSWWADRRQIPVAGDWFLGACFAVCLAVMLNHAKSTPASGSSHRLFRLAFTKLSDLSFSLYLSHFPLVLCLGAILSMNGRMQPTWSAWGIFALSLFGLVTIGAVVWWMFERHTDRVRHLAMAWVNQVSVRLRALQS